MFSVDLAGDRWPEESQESMILKLSSVVALIIHRDHNCAVLMIVTMEDNNNVYPILFSRQHRFCVLPYFK